MANNIGLRESEEIQQMLGSTPSWMLRWGVTIVVITTIVLFVLSWIIKYPDIISSRIVLTTANPPVKIIARSTGIITELLVENHEIIEVNQVIGLIGNTASKEDVLFLEKTLSVIDFDHQPGEIMSALTPHFSLGGIQNTYVEFLQSFRDFVYYQEQKNITPETNILKAQIQEIKNIIASQEKQKNFLVQETAIVEKNHKRNEELLKGNIISEIEYEETKKAYLNYAQQLEVLDVSININQLRLKQTKLQVIQTATAYDQVVFEKKILFESLLNKLKEEIKSWKHNYLIISPINGKVSFTKVWSVNQFVDMKDEILTVVPLEISHIIGKATLDNMGSGKVEQGMKVNILLEGYPYREYGILEGRVERLSLVPNEDNYIIEVSIPNGMQTNYNITIPFSQEIKGVAEVVTQDKKLIERIFERLRSII